MAKYLREYGLKSLTHDVDAGGIYIYATHEMIDSSSSDKKNS